VKGYTYVAACCATKHGVIGLTRALALEQQKMASLLSTQYTHDTLKQF
jgi:NAD(P)-dependent dehydrogenase (short-subunit alcohol dehydrogenase family)